MTEPDLYIGHGVCRRGHLMFPENKVERKCRSCHAANQFNRRRGHVLTDDWVAAYAEQHYWKILRHGRKGTL